MSGQIAGAEVDLAAVADTSVDSGVKHGATLIAFTDAVMARDPDAIGRSREALATEMGPAAVVEAAGVMLMFNVVDRVADATGIPIDEGGAHDLRYAIGSELGMAGQAPEARAAR